MKNYIKLIMIIAFMLVLINAGAQETFEEIIGFDDSVNNTAAPINFLIPLAIAIGAVLGIRKLK